MGQAELNSLTSNKGTGTELCGVVYWETDSSNVYVTVNVWCTQNYAVAHMYTTISLGGTSQSDTEYNYTINSLGEQTLFSTTFPIPENDATLSVTIDVEGESFAGTMSAIGTISGSPSYGPSSISLGASSVQMGKKLLITLNRDSAECEHTLTYSFGGIYEYVTNGYVEGSYTWEVPDMANECSNALSGECTITCQTFRNNSYLGKTTATVTLTVPDPTTPGIDGGDEVTLGTLCKITCQPNSEYFTLHLELEFHGTTVSIADDAVDGEQWTPGYDLAKQIPNLTYGTGTLKCTTYNGTAEVGTRTTTIRVNVPENDVTRPVFNLEGLELSPVSSLPEAFAGLYMRGKTGLKAEFTASSEYSTIVDYTIAAGSQKAAGNPASIDLLISEGDVKITAKVTDARGYSTTVTTSIPVLPYQNPKVIPCEGQSSVICERATENGGLSSNGTWLAIKAGKRYSSVMLEEAEQNSCVLRYRWMPNGGSYCDWITLLAEDSADTQIELVVGNVVSSLQTSYMVQIQAVDALGGEHTLTFQIMTEAVSFVLFDGPDGAGFGKYPEAPHVVDIAAHMTLLCRGKLVVVSTDWVSLGLAEGITEAVYSYGKKKDPGCHWNVANGNHVYVAFDCTFEYTGTRLVINRDPIPEDYRPHRETYVLCPASNQGIALISVDTDGYIRVEWVLNLSDTARSTAVPVEWIDGYLDYWT